jgi:hypothetical protein
MIGFGGHLRRIDAWGLTVMLALGLLAVGPGVACASALLTHPSSVNLVPTPAATQPAMLPPSLLALEQKMDELKITSLRFSLHTSIVITGGEGGGGRQAAEGLGGFWLHYLR